MKQLKLFYVLLASSIIAIGGRIFSTFFEPLKDLGLEKTGHAETDKMLQQLEQMNSLQYQFRTDLVNKFLIALASILLVATVVFIIKKNQSAMVSYFAYLATMILFHTNYFLFNQSLNKQFASITFGGSVTTMTFVISLVIAGVYILITFFSFNRKKEIVV